MQSSSRGNPQDGSSPGPTRAFAPPDLASIPHMDDTSLTSNENQNDVQQNAPTTSSDQEPGPYIVGSPIDLGQIDNVDSIGFHMRSSSVRRSRFKNREHIELQEADDAETTSQRM